MRIHCENCGIQHELDPPAWVLSSGRAFRFRCAGCGHSQSVQPARTPAPAPVEPDEGGHDALSAPRATLTPLPAPPLEVAPKPEPPRTASPAEATADPRQLYLKQAGQVYAVRDDATLRRWIAEGRVERGDLVSLGGVHWGPVESHASYAAFFAADPASRPPRTGDGDAWGDEASGVPSGLPSLSFLLAPATEPAAPATPPAVAPLVVRDVVASPGAADAATPAPLPSVDEEDETLHGVLDDELAPAPLDDPTGSETPAPIELPPPVLALVPDPELGQAAGRHWGEVVYGSERPLHERKGTPDIEERDFEGDWGAPDDRRRKGMLLVGLGVAAAVAVLLAGWWWTSSAPPTPSAVATVSPPASRPLPVPPPVPTPIAPPVPEAAPVAAAPVDAAPAPEPPPRPVPAAPRRAPAPRPIEPAASPQPAPVAASPWTTTASPEPAAPRPAPRQSIRTLIDRGWNAADTAPDEAAGLFEQALAINPGSHEAMYGFGYALLKKGDAGAAGGWLCKARGSDALDIQREVTGLIAQHGIACP